MTEDGSVASLLLHVDPSIRPQDDLFGHVNGGWLSTVEMPPDLPTVGGFIDLALEAEAQVAALLRAADTDAAAGTAPAGSVRQKIGDLFASFLDEDRCRGVRGAARPVPARVGGRGGGDLREHR